MTAKSPSPLVPKLRFSEFQDAQGWSLRPLGEVLNPILREREKPIVPYTGLGIRSHGRGTFRKELEQPEKTKMERLYEVYSDDLIVNITFAWEGAIAIAQPEDTGALVSHRFPTYQFDHNAVLPEFFRYPILDQQFIYNLGVISPGGAGRNRVLNKSDFLKIKLALPEVEEQKKIAGCLGSLVDLIAAEGRKLKALREHKQGLMQQLFPQSGETVPRLRFPEFRDSGEWETRKLGNVISRGKETFDPQKSRDTPRLIELENIESKTGRILSVAEVEKHNSLKSRFQASDVLFGKLRPYLRKFARPDFQGVCTSEIWVLRSKEISSAFLFYLVQTERFIQLANISSGSRMPRAEWNFLAGADFEIPHSDEQRKIADCLGSLDDLIAAGDRKLDALRQHKQGLVQQLFPSQETV